MPSLMAARWAGQNCGPICSHLWTKVQKIKFACAGVSVVSNAVFQFTMSCCIPGDIRDQVAEIFMFLGRQIGAASIPGGRP